MDGRGPYGLACMHCFKAKSKCVGRPDGDGCQRCHRLKKQCSPSDSIRRRNSQKAQGSRIAELEAKLDGLFSIIQSGPQAVSPSTLSQVQQASPTDHPSSSHTMTTPYPPASYNSPPGASRTAEEALVVFRDRMLRFFPFIYLPPTVYAQDLQNERPFLLQVILAITSSTTQERRARTTAIKMKIAQEVVVQNRSNMDLLLGIMAYSAWSYDHYIHGTATVSRLMELAISIINNLHLNKPLPPDNQMMTLLGGTASTSAHGDGQRSMEERRAVLGCFLLSSVMSLYFAQMDSMRWTPQMDDYLAFIEAHPEHSNDLALASQVRLQLLLYRATQVREQQGELPITFFLQSFRFQLQALHESIPPPLQNDDVILAHLYYVKLSIHTTAFLPQGPPPSPTSTPDSTGAPTETSTWDQIDCMQATLQSIRAWVDVFYRIPPDDFPHITMITWAQLGRSLTALFRLATHYDLAWDREAVWRTINLFEVVQRTSESLNEAALTKGEGSDDFWWHVGRLGRTIHAWLGPQMNKEGAEDTPPPQAQAQSQSQSQSQTQIQPQTPAWAAPIAAPGYPAEQFPWDGNLDAAMMRTLHLGNPAWAETLAGWSWPDENMDMNMNMNMGMPPR
ncbi:hypothetical protein BDW59DRAFT_147644 [Aspergillus cavernicola]|uniref:Zn(2)-C6 fungal-type domain-containing protein n=1 Tax=Aspergillus cavernicola TaxID=176166 RepID=A0ABR4I9L9_9EURO